MSLMYEDRKREANFNIEQLYYKMKEITQFASYMVQQLHNTKLNTIHYNEESDLLGLTYCGDFNPITCNQLRKEDKLFQNA